ncbi:chalcone isomerase family protein [Labrenzia sp. CE80]|uniref:chalcone isomerase family protein n=1 Tax=Labrenzia sp. CE80 TaxID=1788986 RepID=UPI001AD8B0E7|nr:chalcone isomerase family protein [Labrenzia sp. CE80]
MATPPHPTRKNCCIAQARSWPDRRNHLLRLGLAILALFSLLALMPGTSRADIGAAAKLVPAASLVGAGRLTFLGFRIFDAKLYAPSGTYDPSKPFALKLTYLRSFKGEAIARRTEKEMLRQGMPKGAALNGWTRDMARIFPDVGPGQSIIGVRDNKGHTLFYSGGRRIGSIKDKTFTKRFFSIWLGSNTNDPALRSRLIGARS